MVIELKKDPISDKTVGQILRYMGWVKRKRANDDEKKVEGVIIISKLCDADLAYALEYTSNITLMKYTLRNKELVLETIEDPLREYEISKFKKLPLEDRKKIIEEYQS